MFESLIREAATRLDLGDNAGRCVRMLADAVFDSGSGGFAGMRARFADAGLGELFASWIGTTPGDDALQADQFSAGFGTQAAERIATRLGIPVATVNTAGAWLLPRIISLVTPGGILPAARPADYDSWFAPSAAPAATATPGDAARPPGASRSPGAWWKWLLVVLVLLALAFFSFRAV